MCIGRRLWRVITLSDENDDTCAEYNGNVAISAEVLRAKLAASPVYLSALTDEEWAVLRSANPKGYEQWGGRNYVIPSVEWFAAKVDGERRVVEVDGEEVEIFPDGMVEITNAEWRKMIADGGWPIKKVSQEVADKIKKVVQRHRDGARWIPHAEVMARLREREENGE